MADRLFGAQEPEESVRAWTHDWISYEQYQVVHVSHLRRLQDEGLVLRDGLSFYESVDGSGKLALVTIRGRVACCDDVAIRVDKKLKVRRGQSNRLEVVTNSYQYHAWVRQRLGTPRRDLIRYDNSRAHDSRLHRHVFTRRGEQVEPVTLAEMPTLGEFIRQAVKMVSNPK